MNLKFEIEIHSTDEQVARSVVSDLGSFVKMAMGNKNLGLENFKNVNKDSVFTCDIIGGKISIKLFK